MTCRRDSWFSGRIAGINAIHVGGEKIIMRKSLIRWVLLAAIVLGIIIGGPIIINEFYRKIAGI